MTFDWWEGGPEVSTEEESQTAKDVVWGCGWANSPDWVEYLDWVEDEGDFDWVEGEKCDSVSFAGG